MAKCGFLYSCSGYYIICCYSIDDVLAPRMGGMHYFISEKNGFLLSLFACSVVNGTMESSAISFGFVQLVSYLYHNSDFQE